jgi:hypothetical protein
MILPSLPPHRISRFRNPPRIATTEWNLGNLSTRQQGKQLSRLPISLVSEDDEIDYAKEIARRGMPDICIALRAYLR